jgi:hypothetical protein
MKPLLIVAFFSSTLIAAPAQTSSPDAEGFIRNWLVLAPVAMDGESGALEIDKEFLEGEATVRPKPDEKVTVGGRAFTWKAHETSDFFIDFLKSFGTERGEYVVGYAAAYVVADTPTKATLALSSNDQGKAWLNGKEVFKFTETRTLEKDTDRTEVMLEKGQNVLVLKIINEVNNWQACARFLVGGAPAKNIKIALAPQ